LILAAAILHVSVTLAVFMAGRYELFPSQISPSGIGRFAFDGFVYQDQVGELSNILKTQGLRVWANWPNQLHVRLYSLPHAAVSRWVSFNILTIEPLNLIYYLAIVVFVFKIAAAIFDHRTGLIAAAMVALWPSFLLHTTQLLRDPLLILAVVVLVYCLVELIKLRWSWRRTLLLGLASSTSLVTVRIVRLPMWYVIVALFGMAAIFFVVRTLQTKQLNRGAVAYALLMVLAFAVIPRLQPFFHNQQELGRQRYIENEEEDKLPIEQQVYRRREAFRYALAREGETVPADDASRIDEDVKLNSPGSIIRHLPRALEVGLFAPFPNMWLRAGKQVGYSGRVISGFETLLTYVIESMALVGLWWQRKNLAAWLLAIAIGLGAVALGLVVNNMGAMYRLRYPFWVLMVVLGAGGISFLWERFKVSKSLHNNSNREIST
jgi:ABC-type multidrug transport system fused ATPase/permease subunit